MALSAGTKPTTYTSTLTGLAKTIYNQWIADGIVQSSNQITKSIGDTAFTEKTSVRDVRVLNDKLQAWSTAKALITELTANAEIKTNTDVTVETYAAGVGTNGGALNATSYPVTGSVKLPSTTAIAKIY